MRRVSLAGASSLPCGHRWDATAGDLAIEVAGELVDSAPIDSIFVADPAAAATASQSNSALVIVDRLGLAGKVSVMQLEAGDASGAAALHAAYASVRAGISRAALVLGVAKVSDESERDRAVLLDTLLDRDAETTLGLTYGSLAGLLAKSYLLRYGIKRGVFARVVAKNAANAVKGGETFLRHAPSPQEIRKDIPVAPPLVRSDFAPLFDGATALIVAEASLARELCETPVEILAATNATDLSVLSDRPDMHAFSAVSNAAKSALAAAEAGNPRSLPFVEVHNSCSIVEVLALESLGVTEPGATGPALKDGLGLIGSDIAINPSGGQHGRGMAFGVAGVEQAREAFLQLGPGADARQVESAAQEGARTLSVSIAGFGSQAFATVYGRQSQ